MKTFVGSNYRITNGPNNEEILAAHSHPYKGVAFFIEGESELYVYVSLRTILRTSVGGSTWIINGVTIPEGKIMKDAPRYEVRANYDADNKGGTFEFLREISST